MGFRLQRSPNPVVAAPINSFLRIENIPLIINIVGLILGIFMLVNPFLTMVSIPYMIGCYLIFLGADGIVMALNILGSNR